MDDTAVATFTSITGTTPEKATQYLGLTEGDVQQAIEFFYTNDGAELEAPNPSISGPTPQAPHTSASRTRLPGHGGPYEDEEGVVHIDSDLDSDVEAEPSGQSSRQIEATIRSASNAQIPSPSTPPTYQSSTEVDADAALARRLQEEFYGATGTGAGPGGDGIRAPMGRTTETLVGPDSFDPDNPGDMHAAVMDQLRARQRPRPRGKY